MTHSVVAAIEQRDQRIAQLERRRPVDCRPWAAGAMEHKNAAARRVLREGL